MTNHTANRAPTNQTARRIIIFLLLVLILLGAAYFRFTGLDWGEYQYLHPDERFLIWVGTDISPVSSFNEYFDTVQSSLNPHNRGHGFYVYGTFPMFVARYLVEGIYGHSGFQEMTDVGRVLSAIADLGTVLLVFLIAKRLYDERVGLLAAAFSAGVVLQIQQAHFFTMDSFLTFFSTLAFFFAVLALKTMIVENHQIREHERTEGTESLDEQPAVQPTRFKIRDFVNDPLFFPCLGFGLALGMAAASKLNAAAIAFTLPIAFTLFLLKDPRVGREKFVLRLFLFLVFAALVSLAAFRILQPYAFSGPGFFGIKPNPQWVDNIREQRAQSNGNVDFPPAMQWARRPVWFSLQNMVLWGVGLPLGLLVWAGFIWVGWRLLSNWHRKPAEWFSHALIWSWTAAYFFWQSIQLNPTMRYQLPIYPTLVVLGAWGVVSLYDRGKHRVQKGIARRSSQLLYKNGLKIFAVIAGASILLLTLAYAFAFVQIYNRPITRIAASRWIYENIPGPINLPIESETGAANQILPFPYDRVILSQLPFSANFQPKVKGILSEIYLPQVVDLTGNPHKQAITVTISRVPHEQTPLTSGTAAAPGDNGSGYQLRIQLNKSVQLDPDSTYNLMISLEPEIPVLGFDEQGTLIIEPYSGLMPHPQNVRLDVTDPRSGRPVEILFQPELDGSVSQIHLVRLTPAGQEQPSQNLGVSLQPADPDEDPLYTSGFSEPSALDHAYTIHLDEPLPVIAGESYRIFISVGSGGAEIKLFGSGLANEGEWDDGLPLRMDGYDGFGGIYPPDLNFNMYWDETPEKLDRFLRILDEAEYIAISSNRQWGSLPRMPERFPLSSLYYRSLIGCPPEQTIENCYRVAKPGSPPGNLGFELTATYSSEPSLGWISLNDQFAEEAFTVYDHPKVLIFRKTGNYDSLKVRSILSSVDFSRIIRKPPLKYSDHPEDLILPLERWEEQQAGGTWSEIFESQSPINRYPVLAVLAWYLSVALLGALFYPIMRIAMPGLDDRGYPIARVAGMLALSYIVWLASSFRIPFSQGNITLALGLLAGAGSILAFVQRKELSEEWKTRKRYFLIVEALSLAFFLAFLLVRFGNPDLWHPWKGGEKPMDFAYFNAILKSTSFPPYDPWYAGGYLNYYYYGFVLVGVLVKWLGLVPATAYNLILPTLFSMIALGAFSLAWNLSKRARPSRDPANQSIGTSSLSAYLPAAAAALGMAVFGNLGIIKMIYQGYQRLAAPGGSIESANLATRWIWAFRGFLETLRGASLPYGIGDWYWNPSRIIPAPGDIEPITEFPYFTLLYADLHAHLIAIPLTLLVLTTLTSIVLAKAQWRRISGGGLWFLIAALAVGSLRPTNTWDLPLYLLMSLIAIGFAFWIRPAKQLTGDHTNWWMAIPKTVQRLILSLGGPVLLVVLALLLYWPYAQWYTLGYTQINLWNGTHTPISAYFYHWGLFLMVIIPWMVWETRDWLAKTPLSALKRLRPFRAHIQILILFALSMTALLVFWLEVHIAWLVVPISIWAGLLILRPDQADAKRMVLFLIGSGLVLTLMVEVIVLRGDIGRMNTVFKFYLQVWTLFAISAACALAWLWPALEDWSPSWRYLWQAVFFVVIAGASLYPMMATMAKIEDRMAEDAPPTLDGMRYMEYAVYSDEWGEMDLSQDYRAIRWMQENVVGSPVIVEANLRNLYRWGSRFSIYTGLPGVVGWEWHQQQQRTAVPGTWVTDRILEIDSFYLTEDWEQAAAFLQKYSVQYIILGQQERGHYPGPGLDKFDLANGILWEEVFRDGETVVYKVIEVHP